MGVQLSDDDISACVGDALDQAVDLTVRSLSDRAQLGASAAFALNRIAREGPIRLTTLATREGVSQPSMTQLIQRLERADLVTRLADPDDGRAALIDITDTGRTLLEDRRRQRRERLAPLLASLSPEEQCALWNAARVALPLIERLAASAECATDGAAGSPAETGAVASRPSR